MREVILRPDAEADIENAADYTIEQWGVEQAFLYVRELRRAVEILATTALRYPKHDNIYPGLRRKRSGMHHIYLSHHRRSGRCAECHPRTRDPALHLKMGLGASQRKIHEEYLEIHRYSARWQFSPTALSRYPQLTIPQQPEQQHVLAQHLPRRQCPATMGNRREALESSAGHREYCAEAERSARISEQEC